MSTLSLRSNHPNKVTIHSLPCKIKYSGKAKVSDYFIETEPKSKLPNECGLNGSIIDNKLQQEQYQYDDTCTYFRGRALLKSEMKFNDGICGFQLKKTQTANNTENVWETNGKFDKINVWRLTNKERNKYENTINNWFEISSAINDPIKEIKESKSIKPSSPNADKQEIKDIDSKQPEEEEK